MAFSEEQIKKLKNMKKGLVEKEDERKQKELELERKRKEERERNKSFEQLLNESELDWSKFK
ncbi:YqkE family protein [Bacillus sp. FJAT-47783]|uniref:YqkE family protein n=1 Tax=Bacillus sp. FJAT-47783 TaxID=2922712 RepID=UPI001FACE0A0|nr:YqkE family protein [Bacillus sp. FJAT-47783]